MKRCLFLVAGILVAVFTLSTETVNAEKKKVLVGGASIYIEAMENGLDGFIRAEMLAKKVPLKVVLKREQAHYVLIGSAQERKGSWHEGWLSPNRDKNTASVMVIDRAANEMLWAGEAGDRSLVWGALSRGGPRKVASRIVADLKDVVGPTKELPAPPPLSTDEEAIENQATETPGAAPARPVLTNEDIIKLVKAGISEDVIIARIRSSENAFKLDADGLVALKEAGVPDRVVTAMMEGPIKK